LAAVLALAASLTGFSVSDLTAKITNATTHRDHAYTPRSGRRPKILTPADQHYEMLRMRMPFLFADVGIDA
jgi:hypothetical protein